MPFLPNRPPSASRSLPRRLLRFVLVAALPFGFASSATADPIFLDWVVVGVPGNLADPQTTCQQCGPTTSFGAVLYSYAIGKYEVTNAQYAAFLNAVAADDPNELYNPDMALDEPPIPAYGGIVQLGSPGSFTYETMPGREDRPVNYVGWYDALRFVNWLHNGQPVGPQGPGTTETGAYTITPAAVLANNVPRNGGAQYFLPSESEWYKAAYFRPLTGTYFDYPTSSDTAPTCDAPTSTPNRANCDGPPADAFDLDIDNTTVRGSFTGSPSPNGTYDQGGNVWEWTEQVANVASTRIVRGGSFAYLNSYTAASFRDVCATNCEVVNYGFRVAATVPEPGSGMGLMASIALIAGRAKRRRRP